MDNLGTFKRTSVIPLVSWEFRDRELKCSVREYYVPGQKLLIMLLA